ncbi:hypothetical protein BJ912DRAFT_986951 [Pholiota molesta]|nr:hypothetical protein BJ912DRAFT_986951 [Pholiota molesta]
MCSRYRRHDVWVRMVFVLASADVCCCCQAYVVFASLCVRRWAMELSAEGGCCCAERWGVADVHDRLLPNYAICEQHRGRVGAVFASAGVQR